MSEYWDLYNENKEKLNEVCARGEIIKSGKYHISVEVWIVNSKGQILLTQRHPKKSFPYLWESAGGAVLMGESVIDGAIRELFEEIGININSNELILLGSTKSVNTFIDSFLCIRDISLTQLRLSPNEVIAAKWVDYQEYIAMVQQNLVVPIVNERFKIYKNNIVNN